jgi:hypothetical protein
VPRVGLFKICLWDCRIPDIFRTESGKMEKIAKYLKIFSITVSATGEQKAVS